MDEALAHRAKTLSEAEFDRFLRHYPRALKLMLSVERGEIVCEWMDGNRVVAFRIGEDEGGEVLD